MVGLSLAAALAELSLDVVVIEPVLAEADEQPSFDSRTTALSSGSRRVLEGIGAWSAIAGQATPIRRIHVSERGVFGTATLTAAEQGVPSLGYTIENRLLGKALRERVAGFPKLRISHARVAELEPGKDAIRLRTDVGETHRGPPGGRGGRRAVRGSHRPRHRSERLRLRPARDHRPRRYRAVP